MDSVERMFAIQRIFNLCAAPEEMQKEEVVQEVKRYFQEGIDPNTQRVGATSNGPSFLHVAAQHGNRAMCEILIDNGAATEIESGSSQTPLLLAVKNSHPETVSLLLEKGANVNASDERKETSLHHSILQRRADITSMLLAYHPDIEARDVLGATPLSVAAGLGLRQQCNALLEAGADVNAVTDDGNPPIMIALQESGTPEILEALLINGASMDLPNNNGTTPAQWLEQFSQDDPIKIHIGQLKNRVREYFDQPHAEYYTASAGGKRMLKPEVLLAVALDEFYPAVVRPLLDKNTAEATEFAKQLYDDLPKIFREKHAALGQQLQQEASAAPMRRRSV